MNWTMRIDIISDLAISFFKYGTSMHYMRLPKILPKIIPKGICASNYSVI
jgi:hypothetical protein